MSPTHFDLDFDFGFMIYYIYTSINFNVNLFKIQFGSSSERRTAKKGLTAAA